MCSTNRNKSIQKSIGGYWGKAKDSYFVVMWIDASMIIYNIYRGIHLSTMHPSLYEKSQLEDQRLWSLVCVINTTERYMI